MAGPGLGHNQPPIMTPVEVTAFLAESEASLLGRRDELLAGVVRFREAHAVIEDAETAGKAGDFVKQIQTAVKVAEDHFKPAKEPFLQGGRAVDTFYKGIVEPLKAGLADVRRPINAYMEAIEQKKRAEREAAARAAREAAEESRRQLAEQQQRRTQEVSIEQTIAASEAADLAAKQARVKAADLTRTRGEGGSVTSMRETWEVELLDIAAVPPEFLLFNESAARKAVQSRGLREIPGVRVWLRREAVTR